MRAAESSACPISSRVVAAAYRRFKSGNAAPGVCVRRPIQLQSLTTQWYTPPCILALVRQVFEGGVIDLDPCSDVLAQQCVGAGRIFTEREDGLRQPWSGKVFVNPPFGQVSGKSQQGLFLAKGISEYQAGRVTAAILLMKAAVGYTWFQQVMQYPHAFLQQLVAFHTMRAGLVSDSRQEQSVEPCVANPHGSIVVYLGQNTRRFCEAFSTIAYVPGFNAWAAQAGG